MDMPSNEAQIKSEQAIFLTVQPPQQTIGANDPNNKQDSFVIFGRNGFFSAY
jgi:hypothetical protein